jgi:hypothetical protein
MCALAKSFWRLTQTLIIVTTGLSISQVRAPGVASESWCAAYFEHIPTKAPQLLLFPMVGPEMKIELPAGLSNEFRPILFAPDGKVIYGQTTVGSGIVKIEFKPARQSIVRGSTGLGEIWNIAMSQGSGRLLVSSWSKTKGECGTFEIDPDSGGFQTLRAGRFPDCGGGGWPISPDGKRAMRLSMNELGVIDSRSPLGLVDLGTGEVQPIGVGMAGATWSPDGRWIAVLSGRSGSSTILLVDANNPSRRRNLGPGGNAEWSPDSKRILVAKQQGRQCGSNLWSLEVVDIQTGKRTSIPSSHCRIFQNSTGWMDREAVN